MKQSLSMALALIGSASLAKAYETIEKDLDLPSEVKSTLQKMVEKQCSDWLESVEIRKTK